MQANGTFSLVDAVSEYARKWKTISAEIREYLLQNTTEHNIHEIIQVTYDCVVSIAIVRRFDSLKVR